MALTTLDPNVALIIVDLQKGIVGLPVLHPAVFWRVPTGAGWYVPKTLKFGTTGFEPDVMEKATKSVFQNGVRKPVFRYYRMLAACRT